MKKYVNGELVDMTEQEISEIQTRETLPEAQGNILTPEKIQEATKEWFLQLGNKVEKN